MEMIYVASVVNMFICFLLVLWGYGTSIKKEKGDIKNLEGVINKTYDRVLLLEKQFKALYEKLPEEDVPEESADTLIPEEIVKKEPQLLSNAGIDIVEIRVQQALGAEDRSYHPKYGLTFIIKKKKADQSYDKRFSKNTDIGLGENVLARDQFKFDTSKKTVTDILKEFCNKYQDPKDIFSKIVWETVDFTSISSGRPFKDTRNIINEYFNFDENLYGKESI